MVKVNINYAVFSDNHVNGRNEIPETLGQLTGMIMDNPLAKEWDLIWFSGDFFDRCASFVDNDIFEVMYWIRRFLRWCKENDVAVRVLRGTPSHDWNQSELFELLAGAIEGIDFKYHKILEIDYIERIGAHVLYLPDEWGNGPESTWLEVKAALKEKKLSKVDYGVTHGFFDFQIPKNLPPGVTFTHHKSARYEKIVDRMIYNGHDHKAKRQGKIQVPGSTNRNMHGEEEPKGYIVGVTGKEKDTVRFIENTKAHRYVSIDCRGMEQEEAFDKVHAIVKDLPSKSNVRLEVNSDDTISMSMPAFVRKYPTLRFDPPKKHSIVVKDDKKVQAKDIKTIEVAELNETNFKSVIIPLMKNPSQAALERLNQLHDTEES